MALFNTPQQKGSKETKEEKKARKEAEMLEKFGLENLTGKDLESVRNIVRELTANKFLETGAALTGAKADDLAKITDLNALVEQNWIIIRLLNEINQKLDK